MHLLGPARETLPVQFAPQGKAVTRSLRPAAVPGRQVGIEDAGTRPVGGPGLEVLGAGVFAHSCAGEAHRPRNGEQGFARQVPAPDLVVAALPPGAARSTRRPLGRAARESAVAAGAASAAPAGNAGKHRSRAWAPCSQRSTAWRMLAGRCQRSHTCTAPGAPGAAPRACSVEPAADAARFGDVAGDDLNVRALPQPVRDCRAGAVGQQVDHAPTLQVHHDRAVDPALAHRPIVHGHNPRRLWSGQRQATDQAQHRVGTHRHGQAPRQSGSRFAAQRRTDLTLRLGQPGGPARMRGDQLRQALGKGAPSAFGVSAVEPPGSQPNMDAAPERRQVSRVPAVAAVRGTARAPAIRAAAARPDAVDGNVKQVGAVRRGCLDAAARHGTKLVHALLYGHNCPCSQIGTKPLRSTQSTGEPPNRGDATASRPPCRGRRRGCRTPSAGRWRRGEG